MKFLKIYKIWDMALQEEKVGLEFENEAGVTLHEEIDKKTFLRKQSLADFLTQKGITTSAGDDSIQAIYHDYEKAERIWTVGQIGWVRDAPSLTYMASHATFGDTAFQLKKNVSDTEVLSKKGEFQEWLKVLDLAKCSPILMFSIGIALAALAKGVTKSDDSFGFYIYGKSSIGKTTCLKLAQSVQGIPSNHNTWDVTKGGIEECCFEHNSSLMVLDELRQISSNDRRLCEAVRDASYAISQGKPRKRCRAYAEQMGFSTGGWNLIWLGTGEFSLHDMARKENVALYKGQEVRMIEISAGYSKEFGIFKSIPEGETDSGALIAKIDNIIRNNYGLLGRRWIRKIIAHPDFQGYFQQKTADICSQIVKHFQCQDGVLERVIKNISFPVTSLLIASEMNLLPWTEKEILRAGRSVAKRALESIDPKIVELKDLKTLKKKMLSAPRKHLQTKLYENKVELEESIKNGVIYKDGKNFLIPFRVFSSWFETEAYARSVESTLSQHGLVSKKPDGYDQYTLGKENCRIRMMSTNLPDLKRRITQLKEK